MVEPRWLEIARANLGTKEVPGVGNNPTVLDYYVNAGHPEIKADEVAWCAAFVGSCLKLAGIKPSGSLAARSYESWGQPLAQPLLGCIGVKKRPGGGWTGHVGFVVAADATSVWLLAGNQGDAVSIAKFPRKGQFGVNTFRWPANIPKTSVPLSKTASGKTGVKES